MNVLSGCIFLEGVGAAVPTEEPVSIEAATCPTAPCLVVGAADGMTAGGWGCCSAAAANLASFSFILSEMFSLDGFLGISIQFRF